MTPGFAEQVMAYRLKVHKPVDKNLKRIVREQIDKAVGDLGEGADLHEGVHEARKRLKKIRAVLRLARAALGDTYRQENTTFRDAGRRLSSLRDAEALIETADLLRERFDADAEEQALAALRGALIERRDQVTADIRTLEQQAGDVTATLQAARVRVDGWRFANRRFRAIQPGLKQTYGRGRAALERAFRTRETADFHEWRKRVKDHWHHVRLLRNVWPDVLDSRERALKELSDLLGDDHNLAVLRETIEASGELAAGIDVRLVFGLIETLRAELQQRSRPLGERLFAERPRCFVERLQRYWRVACREAEAARSKNAVQQSRLAAAPR